MPVEPKLSSGPTGCHVRMVMNGSTSSESSTRGELCRNLIFGKIDAAETMNPSRPMTSSWSGDQAFLIFSIITSG
jgi:hypothetical protein